MIHFISNVCESWKDFDIFCQNFIFSVFPNFSSSAIFVYSYFVYCFLQNEGNIVCRQTKHQNTVARLLLLVKSRGKLGNAFTKHVVENQYHKQSQ